MIYELYVTCKACVVNTYGIASFWYVKSFVTIRNVSLLTDDGIFRLNHEQPSRKNYDKRNRSQHFLEANMHFKNRQTEETDEKENKCQSHQQ